MIELKYKDLLGTPMMQALSRLSKERFNQQTAYNIGKILQKLKKVQQLAMQGHRKILDTYAKRDENGQIVVMPNGGVELPDDVRAKAEKELEEYFETSFTIDRNKLPVGTLSCGLTPDEVLALEPLLSGLDELEKDQQARD